MSGVTQDVVGVSDSFVEIRLPGLGNSFWGVAGAEVEVERGTYRSGSCR